MAAYMAAFHKANVVARENFTVARIAGFTCPKGKGQDFLWDTKMPGLALRVTAKGAKAFVFQSRFDGKAIRVTIGDPDAWTISTARDEARRLQRLLDQRLDPRVERAQAAAQQTAQRAAAKAARDKLAVTGLDAWSEYCADRKSHWSDRNHRDHVLMAKAGGDERKRSKETKTQPGPLRSLLNRPLAQVDPDAVEEWLTKETKDRPVRVALAFRQLRAFINWCTEHSKYSDIVQSDACTRKRVRQRVAKPNAKSDALQREQLASWFTEVRKLSPVMSCYLQGALLTGARREELAQLRWDDVDFKWNTLRIRDKVQGERVIPLTPYFANLLKDVQASTSKRPSLPRRLKGNRAAEDELEKWTPSPWVFVTRPRSGERLADPSIAHRRAVAAAGLPNLTIHGLRRSFGTLAEWVECPAGVVAQIQGHKPSAIAEKHYRVRPIDLLRVWHTRIEDWILGEAGLSQTAGTTPRTRQGLIKKSK